MRLAAQLGEVCRCPSQRMFSEVLAPFVPDQRLKTPPEVFWRALRAGDRAWARRALFADVCG